MRKFLAIAVFLVAEIASAGETLSRDQIRIRPAFGKSHAVSFPQSERAAVRLIVSQVSEMYGLENQRNPTPSVLAQYEKPEARYPIHVSASDFGDAIVVDTSYLHKGVSSLTYDRILKDLLTRIRARFYDRSSLMRERLPVARPKP